MDGNELYHYGVLGMKWGVRKARPSSKKSGNKKTSKAGSQTRKRNVKRVVKVIGASALLTVTVNSLLNSQGMRYVSSGKHTVDSFMKKNGNKKISEYEKTWADYAWEEVQKSGWG